MEYMELFNIENNKILEYKDNRFKKIVSEVIIPDGITEIADCVFENCKDLIKVALPESIETINSFVFDKCTNLRSITLPKNLKFIGENSFYDCSGLTEIKNLDKMELEDLPSYCFYNCGLRDIKLSDYLIYIGYYTFGYCSNLTSVTLGKNVEVINRYSFAFCNSLENVEFSQKLSYIGDYAFWECSNLKKVRIPESIREISEGAFFGCTNLDFNVETSLFYFNPNRVNILFSNFIISKLTIYNHEFDYSKNYFKFETKFIKYIREIRREELKNKIDGVLLENGITDKSCFRYSEHSRFIDEIVEKLEVVLYYRYDEDFNKYMEEYIAKNKHELVQMNDIDIVLDRINSTKVNEFDISDSTTMEKFAMELSSYPMLITSLFQAITIFYTQDLEQIKMKKILDSLNNTNNLSNFINRVFFNINDGDVTVNKNSIEKLRGYSTYKINIKNSENEYLEKLKRIIKIYITKIDESLEMLNDVKLNNSLDELSKSDNDLINNNITIKINTLNDSKIFIKNLYIEINNIISSNFIYLEKLKEALTLLIPIISCGTLLNTITLRTKEQIEVLDSALNILNSLSSESNTLIEINANEKIKKLIN